MLRFTIVFFMLGMSVITIQAQKYTTKYDNIDIEDILRNNRLLNGYIKCLTDKGRCSPDGAELKRTLPDALATSCSSCSPRQRDGAMRIVSYLTANKPEVWRELSAKYDPHGVYAKRLRQQG